jgi:hypothetical protein
MAAVFQFKLGTVVSTFIGKRFCSDKKSALSIAMVTVDGEELVLAEQILNYKIPKGYDCFTFIGEQAQTLAANWQ